MSAKATDPDLPSPPSVACAWDDRESEPWTVAVEEWEWKGRGEDAEVTWVKSGFCPQCRHRMSVVFDGGLVVPIKAQDLPLEAKPSVLAFCNCAVDHEGHPASDDPELYRRGCGRWGLVKPPPAWPRKEDVKTGLWLYWATHLVRRRDKELLVTPQPPDWGADPSDRAWEAEALGGRTALTEIRQAAEKWSQSIAAILGVFTIVAFVKGPDSFEKISHRPALAAAVLVVMALVLAGGGILLGALAAQTTPRKKTRLTGWELKKFYAHQARKALSVPQDLAVL
jgi:hypothetical protein